MKVLIVFNHPAPYKVRMFNELAKFVDLTVLFERKKEKNRNDDFYSDNKYNFEHIILTKGYVKNDGSISLKVKDYIKKNASKFDFIIMNGISHYAEIRAILYMQKKKIPYSVLINGGIAKTKEPKFKFLLKTKMIKGASFWISPSKKSDDYLITYGADKKKIYRYPYSNIANADLVGEVNKEEIRKEFNLPLDKRIFVNSSQFIDRKNNLELLGYFKGKDDILLLIGEGEEQPLYEKYIKENNMNNVIIMPFLKREDLFRLISSCDVFITLAKEDIFGQTTIEALANGLPVISSTNVNSSLEYIINGENGYLVNILNKKEIKEAIEESKKLSRSDAIDSVRSITFEQCGKRMFDILEKAKTNE